jgi:hypothetical protein
MDEILTKVTVAGNVTPDDALAARRAVYGAGLDVSSVDMELLFRIDQAARVFDPAWQVLLSEASVDYVVHQADPEDTVDAAGAGWLIGRISTDGKVRTATGLEVLVRVLEESRSAPATLAVLALRQIRAAVVDGEGPLAAIAAVDRGRVTRAHAKLARRILFAFGGQGNVAITREEADVIFDINDASVGAANDPEWGDLFVKAIANCIMAASGYLAPPREFALGEERRPPAASFGTRGSAPEAAINGLRGIIEAYREPASFGQMPRNAPVKLEIQAKDAAAKDEAAWLAERIGRDGVLDANEKALLRLIRDEAANVHPTLKKLFARAA